MNALTQQTLIDPRPSANYWIMYALITKIQHTFKRWTFYEGRIADLRKRINESPRELARQSEAKRKQAPQSEANVCRHKCNLKKTLLLIEQDTQ